MARGLEGPRRGEEDQGLARWYHSRPPQVACPRARGAADGPAVAAATWRPDAGWVSYDGRWWWWDATLERWATHWDPWDPAAH